MVRCSHQLLSDSLYARFFHRLELEGMASVRTGHQERHQERTVFGLIWFEFWCINLAN